MGLTKPNQTSFKPGISGNPNGRPKLDQDTKTLRKIASDHLIRALAEFALGKKKDLDELVNDEELSMMEIMLLNLMLKNSKQPRLDIINFLFDRLVGRVPNMSDEDQKKLNSDPALVQSKVDLIMNAVNNIK